MVTSARVIIEVTAGVIPGTVEGEYTRRYALSSDEWHAANGGDSQFQLLAELNGRALGYAGLLMMQPDRLNWVHTDWLWL